MNTIIELAKQIARMSEIAKDTLDAGNVIRHAEIVREIRGKALQISKTALLINRNLVRSGRI